MRAIALSLFCISIACFPIRGQADTDRPSDTLKLRDVEVTFHKAGSVMPQKDLELMMSLYTDGAVLIDTAHDDKRYEGKDQVRAYWRDVSGPFRPQNHWIGYTSAMRIKTKVSGNTATLYFECLWMDVDHNSIGTHSFSDMQLVRKGKGWLVKTVRVGRVAEL